MNTGDTCQCAACAALAAQYQNDPALLAYYRSRLLVRGWAGSKSPVEKAYILAHAPFAQAGALTLAKIAGLPPKCQDQEAELVGAVR